MLLLSPYKNSLYFPQKAIYLHYLYKEPNVQKKSLIETNPYLQDLKKYRRSLITNVSSSTAIETGDSVLSVTNTLTEVADRLFIVTPLKQKSTSQ